MEGGAVGHNFEMGLSKDYPSQDLNVIFCQNMPNLHNLNKSAEPKIPQKNLDYMQNYSMQCSCS